MKRRFRETREYRLLTFRTTTEAMAMEAAGRDYGIPGRLIPIPTQITAGCGLAWRMLPEEYEAHKAAIEATKITFEADVLLTL